MSLGHVYCRKKRSGKKSEEEEKERLHRVDASMPRRHVMRKEGGRVSQKEGKDDRGVLVLVSVDSLGMTVTGVGGRGGVRDSRQGWG